MARGAIQRDGKDLLKTGGQVFQHFAVILIFQQAKDRHKVAVISGFFQSCSKGCGAIGIVAAIQQQQRVAAHDLDPCGHFGIPQTGFNRFIGDLVMVFPPEGPGQFPPP